MGPKKWCFKIIFRRKKPKEDKSNQEKEQSTNEISNEPSNGKQNPNEESSSTPNEGLMMERTVPSKLIDNIAATRIQNAFRSFMARRTFQNLSRAEKFDALIQDHMATDQTATTLNYIHSWSRIQDEIRARRICMITAARIKQRRLESQLKVEAKINELETEWCSGSETMEEILSRIHQREEAAIKRERTMAYAFSHQWRPNCNQYFGQASYSLGKESWGWSWMERWVAARPWEVRVQAESPKTKKLNGQQKNTKLDKTNHNETKSPLAKAAQLDKVNHNETKSPLAKAALSNGKETEKGKKNKT
ncbi:IQ-domain [Trifolium repens]|nr:IQ-domain [Trifolium repens]